MTPSHPSGDRHWTKRDPDRVLRGTKAPGAKLNAHEIAEMCAAFDAGDTNRSRLARIYGVSRITIWRHLKARGLL